MMVRPLIPADRARWQPLWQGYLAFYKADVAPQVSDVTFARLTGGGEPMGGFIATDDDVAVGIGRKLIETVYDKARGLGCSRVYWLTHETNADAMRLYDGIADRSGFVQYRKVF
jgi:GNAT superfamily N-acetyltransferase